MYCIEWLIYPLPMWTLMAIRKMAMNPKKRREWTKMETPLVWKLQKSTALPLPGSWKSNPGESTTNKTKPITTPAQSPITISLKLLFGRWKCMNTWRKQHRWIYLYRNVWRVLLTTDNIKFKEGKWEIWGWKMRQREWLGLSWIEIGTAIMQRFLEKNISFFHTLLLFYFQFIRRPSSSR